MPLSELSDLHTPDDITLAGKKMGIVSYLPKTLRVHNDFPLNNVYILFIEDTDNVDLIEWNYKLYKNGAQAANLFSVTDEGLSSNRLSLTFRDMFEANGTFRFDRLKLTCKVKKGAETREMVLYHSFARMVNVKETGIDTDTQHLLFQGEPQTSNYLINHLHDYFESPLKWRGESIDLDLSSQKTLLRIVIAIINHNFITSKGFIDAEKYFRFEEYENKGMADHLNDNKPYSEELTNGLLGIQLHVLNEIMGDTLSVPDFTDINPTQQVFSMIKYDPQVRLDTIEDELLVIIPLKLQDLRERLMTDKQRYTELYNLTLFPKAAIRLAAIIVRYLFECSKENDCRDCKNRFGTWPLIGIDGLKDNQDFLKNTLTHYFNGPSNNINNFAEKAIRTTPFVWSPVMQTIVSVPPRIVKAYFAKKIVKEVNVAAGPPRTSDFIFDFERIDNNAIRVDDDELPLAAQPDFDNIIGRNVYLVIETTNSRGKELTVNIHPGTGVMTGDTNSLELFHNGVFTTDFRAVVGDVSALHNETNAMPGTERTLKYAKLEHADKAIIRLSLLPRTRAIFNNWTGGPPPIAAAAGMRNNQENLEIAVRRTDNTEHYFGNNVRQRMVTARFLGTADPYDNTARYRIANYIAYEVYHEDNRFRINNTAGDRVLKIGRIDNEYVKMLSNDNADAPFKKISFYYHDKIGNEHEVATTRLYKARQKVKQAWVAGTVTGPALVPPSVSYAANRTAGEEIDAITMNFYENGTYAEGKRNVYTDNLPNEFTWYRNLNAVETEELADAQIIPTAYMGPNDMPAIQYERRGVKIQFNFDNTRRRYVKPNLFAALIGTLQRTYERNSALVLISQGFAYQDGSCFPSQQHVNGNAMDTNYFAHNDTQNFIFDLHYYGYRTFLVGHGMVYVHGTPDAAGVTLHTGHLHSSGFANNDQTIVRPINP